MNVIWTVLAGLLMYGAGVIVGFAVWVAVELHLARRKGRRMRDGRWSGGQKD